MHKYEGMFVTWNKEARKDHDYLADHVKGLVEKVGGKVARISRWDERQLAYEIKGQRDGIFYLSYFEADGPAVTELRREAELSDIVLRMLVLRLDKIPDEEEVQRQSGRASDKDRERSRDAAPASAPAEKDAERPAAGEAPAEKSAGGDAPATEAAEKPAAAVAPATEKTEQPAGGEPPAAETAEDQPSPADQS